MTTTDPYEGHFEHCYIREGAHCSCGNTDMTRQKPAASVPLSDTHLTAAEVRLAQYGEQATWSNATYGSGTEKALHEIALGLKAEVNRLRGEFREAMDNYHGAAAEAKKLRAVLAEIAELHEPMGGDCGYCADETESAHRWPCPTAKLAAPTS